MFTFTFLPFGKQTLRSKDGERKNKKTHRTKIKGGTTRVELRLTPGKQKIGSMIISSKHLGMGENGNGIYATFFLSRFIKSDVNFWTPNSSRRCWCCCCCCRSLSFISAKRTLSETFFHHGACDKVSLLSIDAGYKKSRYRDILSWL